MRYFVLDSDVAKGALCVAVMSSGDIAPIYYDVGGDGGIQWIDKILSPQLLQCCVAHLMPRCAWHRDLLRDRRFALHKRANDKGNEDLIITAMKCSLNDAAKRRCIEE